MLDINYIRENKKKVEEGCKNKNVDVDIDKILALDEERRKLIKLVEDLRSKKNKISSSGKISEEKAKEAREIKEKEKELASKLKEVEEKFYSSLEKIPNIPFDDVPIGKDESYNVVVKKVGEPKKFSFKPKNHLEIGEALDLVDTKRASKISGSRFGYLKNEAVFLELALVNFAFDFLTRENNFTPVIPPVLIKPEIMKAMAYIDSKEELAERYFLEKDNMFLVGTAEQSVAPMHKDEIFNESDLPKRFVAFSSCFREEAGSYGKDTTGILRVHQFDKVEMVSYSLPEKSEEEHKFLISLEEKLIGALELPYQLVHLSTGDISKPSASTFDIETWMPGQNKYRETNSCSNCTDYQSRRLNIRYKNKEGKTNYVHILNGTVFAIGRIIIAILENNQREDGKINIPKILQKYIPGEPKTIPFLR